MLFRFPLFASLAFRVLSLCAVVKVRFAIPENDIVQTFLQVSTVSFYVPVSLRLSDLCPILILLADSLLSLSRPRAMRSAKTSCLPRKEVIQPHLPIRLPCYDFTPVIGLTFDGCSLR